MGDIEMSDGEWKSGDDNNKEEDEEETKKRTRSKFSSERDDNIEYKNALPQQTHKGPKLGRDNYKPAPSLAPVNPSESLDDFSALLHQHEQQKQLANKRNARPQQRNEQQHSKHNPRHNNNDNKNTNNNNKNNPKNNKNNNRNNNRNNKDNNKKNNETPINISRYDRQFDPVTLPQDQDFVAEKITYFLREPNKGLIAVVLIHLGIPETLKYVRATACWEEKGGMMTSTQHDVARRRSPGGAFFHLVKEGVTDEQRKLIFTDERGKRYKKTTPHKPNNYSNQKENNKNSNNNTKIEEGRNGSIKNGSTQENITATAATTTLIINETPTTNETNPEQVTNIDANTNEQTNTDDSSNNAQIQEEITNKTVVDK